MYRNHRHPRRALAHIGHFLSIALLAAVAGAAIHEDPRAMERRSFELESGIPFDEPGIEVLECYLPAPGTLFVDAGARRRVTSSFAATVDRSGPHIFRIGRENLFETELGGFAAELDRGVQETEPDPDLGVQETEPDPDLAIVRGRCLRHGGGTVAFRLEVLAGAW